MRNEKKITINDIARLANVAKGTVSNVLNNKPCVKPETRQRVLEICQKYNFSRNNIAVSLSSGKTNFIGVFLEVETDTYYALYNEVLSEMIPFFRANGYYTSVFFNTSSKIIHQYLAKGQMFIDAAVVMTPEEIDKRIEDLESDRIPTAVIGNIHRNIDNMTCVDVDNELIVYKIVKDLYLWGHKKILLFNSRKDYMITKERDKGYIKAVNEFNLISKKNIYTDYNEKSAYEAIYEYLSNDKDIDAIICGSVLIAIECYKVLEQFGLEVGKDVSIVALGGENAESLNPPVSNLYVDFKHLSKKASESLINLINGEKHDSLYFSDRFSVNYTKSVRRDKCNDKR